MNQGRFTTFVSLLLPVFLLAGCGNDSPEPGSQPADSDTDIVVDSGLSLASVLCRSPLESNGVLTEINGSPQVPIWVWSYECEKEFGSPQCSAGYDRIYGEFYIREWLDGETSYSSGRINVSYQCRGPISATDDWECHDGMTASLQSTSEHEKTYNCKASLDTPYCHADFRSMSALYSGSKYAWEGGWGPGRLYYSCSHWSLNDDPPDWPVN